jgi:hypothetical protein
MKRAWLRRLAWVHSRRRRTVLITVAVAAAAVAYSGYRAAVLVVKARRSGDFRQKYDARALLADYLRYREDSCKPDEAWSQFMQRWVASGDALPDFGQRPEPVPNSFLAHVAAHTPCGSISAMRAWVKRASRWLIEVKALPTPEGCLRVSSLSERELSADDLVVLPRMRLLELLLGDASLQTDGVQAAASLRAYDHVERFAVNGRTPTELRNALAGDLQKWCYLLDALYYTPGRFDDYVRDAIPVVTIDDLSATLYEGSRRMMLAGIVKNDPVYVGVDGLDSPAGFNDLEAIDLCYTKLALRVRRRIPRPRWRHRCSGGILHSWTTGSMCCVSGFS